jgi:hypothetical protein
MVSMIARVEKEVFVWIPLSIQARVRGAWEAMRTNKHRATYHPVDVDDACLGNLDDIRAVSIRISALDLNRTKGKRAKESEIRG